MLLTNYLFWLEKMYLILFTIVVVVKNFRRFYYFFPKLLCLSRYFYFCFGISLVFFYCCFAEKKAYFCLFLFTSKWDFTTYSIFVAKKHLRIALLSIVIANLSNKWDGFILCCYNLKKNLGTCKVQRYLEKVCSLWQHFIIHPKIV